MNKKEKFKTFINKYYGVLIPISLIIILILVFAIYSIHKLYVNHTTDQNASFYQYFAGMKVEYDAVLKLNRQDNIVDMDIINKKIDLTTVPIYFKDNEVKVLFPKSMTVVRPLKNYKQEKIVNYSTITWDKENNKYLLKSNEYDKELEYSFLYDGVDLYFFLMENIITIGNEEITLSPMSYIRVNVGNGIEYYDRETDTYKILDMRNEQVVAKNDYYNIELNYDQCVYFDSFTLLMGPSYLNEIK